jgi:hypothetical protein
MSAAQHYRDTLTGVAEDMRKTAAKLEEAS